MKKLFFWFALSLLLVASACAGISTTSSPAILTSATLQPSASPLPNTATPTTTQPPTNTPLPSETSTPVAYGPDLFPANVDPLTGLEVIDPTLLSRRPVSVKVQIFPRGQRPPWGISLADLVFDYYQNSGMTRFHAIFYSNNAEQVGPIRSGRLLDKELVSMYKSLLAFGGADRRILNIFFNSDFSDRLVMEGAGKCPPMCRIDPNGYNYLVANTAEISNYAVTKGISNTVQTLNGMYFNAAIPAGGQPANPIFIRYSISAYTRWDYDPSTGRYLRFQDTQEDEGGGEGYAPMTDRLTGAQAAADNVVVVLAPHSYAFSTHPGINEIIDISLSGNGVGYAFRDGQVYQINWHRPNKDSILMISFPDGTLYPFKPGNTWFEVIGQSSQIQNPSAGAWRFVFNIP
jgi:hypothetical protein